MLSEAFKTANTDVEKFTAVVQNIRGVGLSIEDQAKAIQLVTRLTEQYRASFDKVGNAITGALESGKVSQATLNQLSSQGIDIQGALADKLNVSRDRIIEMAKKGQINVQDLVDTLVELGNEPQNVAQKTQTASQQLQSAFSNLTKIVGPELEKLTQLFIEFGVQALNALNGVLTRLAEVGAAIEKQVAGDTLKNAQEQFRKDAKVLQQLYKVPKEDRSQAQIQRITTLENLQQGRLAVIRSAQPAKPTPLETFKAPSQALPTGAGKTKKERESRVPELQIEVQLAEKLAALNLRIAEAKDSGNQAVEHALEMEKILEERSAAISKIKLQDIPAAEKDLQIRLATVQADEKLRNIIIERNKVSKEAADAAQKVLDTSKKEIDAIQKKRDKEKEYAQLIKEGVLPANAENYLQTKELVKSAIESAEAAIVEAEARGASAAKVKELRENLDKIRKQGQSEIDNAKTTKPGATIEDAITKARGELNELIDVENQVIAGAKAIGSAFRDAFTGLVSGAMTGQEALAAFFKGVGDHFMDMAAQMIAKLIEIYILETVLGFISGSIGSNSAMEFAGPGATGTNTFAYGAGVPKFADGGMVTRPTLGMIGEGGEAEYIIPASKMRGAMNRYAAGARGSAVIPAGDGGDGGTATMVATPGAIDVRYTVERINSVDYVTADQFQQGMQQAAQQGAAQGEQRTLRRLQMSTSTRKRLGM
jgi:tape measure domain-containing protein